MIKKNNVVKNIILVITVVALMGLIVYLVGRSYGFFRYEKQGETTNVITIKGIRVDIIEDDDALNLLNTEPLYDSDGLELKAFKFSITNTSSRPLDYTMKVVNDTDKQSACLINEGTANEAACPVLTTDNIRYSYKLNNSNWVEPSNLGLDNDVITTYTINGGETLTYSIKMWIKSDATNDIMNHYFFGQLLIQGTQAAQEMYRPYDVATILSNFNQEDLKEVVACDNDNRYTNCSIYNTIEDAISAKSKSVIILTEDLDKNAVINIPADKDITLDLNGKKIETINPDDPTDTITSLNTAYNAIKNNGKLVINDSLGGGSITSPKSSRTIENIETGELVINGGSYNGRQAVVSRGNTVINGGTFNSKNGSSISADKNLTTINNGTFTGTVYNNGIGTLDIKDGTYISGQYISVNNMATGTINITGGTFTSNSNTTVLNNSTGTININQTDKPIYITSLAESWKPVILNNSTGTINITVNQANQCTATASDTTSGLCVYAAGAGNAAVRNTTTGTVNITGGTYYAKEIGIQNVASGILNIKNSNVTCEKAVIYNVGAGVVNICNTTLKSIGGADIGNISTGTVNYNNVTFTNGTTTTPDVYNPNGTVTASATCPISE